jgi:hypothetical protein
VNDGILTHRCGIIAGIDTRMDGVVFLDGILTHRYGIIAGIDTRRDGVVFLDGILTHRCGIIAVIDTRMDGVVFLDGILTHRCGIITVIDTRMDGVVFLDGILTHRCGIIAIDNNLLAHLVDLTIVALEVKLAHRPVCTEVTRKPCIWLVLWSTVVCIADRAVALIRIVVHLVHLTIVAFEAVPLRRPESAAVAWIRPFLRGWSTLCSTGVCITNRAVALVRTHVHLVHLTIVPFEVVLPHRPEAAAVAWIRPVFRGCLELCRLYRMVMDAA